MGMNNYVYFGAYIDVPDIQQTIEVNKYRCSNTQCKNHKKLDDSNKFCPACGNPGEEYKENKTVTESLHFYNLVDKYNLSEDDLFPVNEYAQWIPNGAYGGTKVTYDKYSNEGCKAIKAETVDKSIEAFKTKYKAYLDAVKAEYGFDLEVSFGVVSYYM